MIDIDALKRDKRPQSSTIVHALIDRLEAAEKERDALRADKAILQQMMYSLKDRLEVAESEALEEARLNGMGSERELALMAKLEAAEKEIALKERVIDALGSELNAVANERDALQAKIAEMEQQEPVAWGVFHFGGKRNGKLYSHCESEKQARMYILGRHQSDDSNTFREAPLYALPSAQPAPSVPEGWKLVPVEPTQEMINHVIKERLEALVAWKEHTFIDIYKAMLAAAAPEAKP